MVLNDEGALVTFDIDRADLVRHLPLAGSALNPVDADMLMRGKVWRRVL
jgi:hypothetical protein